MALAYVSVGRDVNGRNALLAPPAAAWWRLFALVVKLTLDVNLEIIQAKGTADASAGTHPDGWAVDIRTWRFSTSTTLAVVALARTYGASATWYRTEAHGFVPHIHLVIDAGAQYTASRYQTVAVRAGSDGLGYLGRRRPDPHPAPARWVTAEQGIALMHQQIGTLVMALTDSDAQRVATAILGRSLGSSGPTVAVALQDSARAAHTARDVVTALLTQSLGSSGPNVAVALQDTHGRTRSIEAKVEDLADQVAQLVAALAPSDLVATVEPAAGGVA